jgi:hypothetical protein
MLLEPTNAVPPATPVGAGEDVGLEVKAAASCRHEHAHLGALLLQQQQQRRPRVGDVEVVAGEHAHRCGLHRLRAIDCRSGSRRRRPVVLMNATARSTCVAQRHRLGQVGQEVVRDPPVTSVAGTPRCLRVASALVQRSPIGSLVVGEPHVERCDLGPSAEPLPQLWPRRHR